MVIIEKRNNDYTSKRVPAYERLAMLYERQKRFDKAIEVCNDAIKNDASFEVMLKRKDRLLKKPKSSVATTKSVSNPKSDSNQNKRKNLNSRLHR